jgi:hypothetical protein
MSGNFISGGEQPLHYAIYTEAAGNLAVRGASRTVVEFGGSVPLSEPGTYISVPQGIPRQVLQVGALAPPQQFIPGDRGIPQQR